MSENKTVNTLLNIELPSSADNALKNLSDKPSLSIGTTLADLWYLVFGGITQLSEKKKIKYAHNLDVFRKELEASIKQIPEEKVIEPSIQVTAQALENSKYCIEEDELRRMFTSLICNSMNSDYSQYVHPSFAEIIKQMSVLDAKIIRLFKDKSGKFIRLPVCKYVLYILGSPSYIDIPDHIFLELADTDFRLCSQSLSSLSRLGMLTITYGKKLDTPNLYEKFTQHPAYEYAKENYPFANVKIIEGTVEATPLGKSFIDICISD